MAQIRPARWNAIAKVGYQRGINRFGGELRLQSNCNFGGRKPLSRRGPNQSHLRATITANAGTRWGAAPLRGRTRHRRRRSGKCWRQACGPAAIYRRGSGSIFGASTKDTRRQRRQAAAIISAFCQIAMTPRRWKGLLRHRPLDRRRHRPS